MYYKDKLKGLMCILLLLIPFYMNAVNVLVIEVNNSTNSEVVFALKDNPKYWIEGQSLKLSSSTTSAEFPISTVVKAYFKTDLSVSLNESASDKISCYPNPTVEGVYITHVEKGASVMLCDMTGKVISQPISFTEDSVYIDLSNLPTGSYFVKVNQQSFKIIKQ
ncbi:MAG: T9SS type A sorting domain-containing protein [Paludibacteraceae bacterium]|nr:T9SS type A sorting domain-containing protein [Paludibacteraceae bacterium]